MLSPPATTLSQKRRKVYEGNKKVKLQAKSNHFNALINLIKYVIILQNNLKGGIDHVFEI